MRGYQEAGSTFNAGITLRNVSQGWSIAAECNNCFDRRYVASFLIFPYLNEPGRWSIRVRKDF